MTDSMLAKDIDLEELSREMVLSRVPKSERSFVGEKLTQLLKDWEGREADVLCVLYYASEMDETQDYINELERIHHKYLRTLPTKGDYRRNLEIPGANSTELEVQRLYDKLGVEPQR